MLIEKLYEHMAELIFKDNPEVLKKFRIKAVPDIEEGELCPLCNEPLDNGKSHGSWCK